MKFTPWVIQEVQSSVDDYHYSACSLVINGVPVYNIRRLFSGGITHIVVRTTEGTYVTEFKDGGHSAMWCFNEWFKHKLRPGMSLPDMCAAFNRPKLPQFCGMYKKEAKKYMAAYINNMPQLVYQED